MASLVRLLAFALAWAGAAALLPALVSARFQEGLAPIFLATTLACVFLAGAMHLASAGLTGRIRRFQVFAALCALWLLIPVVAAPAVAAGAKLDLGAAWFEALSAFTTTGFTAVHEGPRSLFVWFSLLQWCGGLLTLVSAVAILAPAGIAGLPDRAVQRLDEREAVDTLGVLKEVGPLYFGGFAIAFLALLFTGTGPYLSFCLASAATSAGAHLPPGAHAALQGGGPTQLVFLPFLLWAATSVRWHRALVNRRVHAAPEQPESLILLGYWLVLGLFLAVLLFRLTPGSDVVDALKEGLFTAAALISTSFLPCAPDTYAHLPAGLLILVSLVGGGALSVAGGLKILRVRAMALRARGDLARLISPNIVQPSRTGEGGIGTAMRGVWIGLVALCATLAAVTVTLGFGAPSFEAALTGAVAAISNSGPLYDASGQNWPAISSLPAISMLGAAFAMIAGRIEVVGAFVLIHLAFWRT